VKVKTLSMVELVVLLAVSLLGWLATGCLAPVVLACLVADEVCSRSRGSRRGFRLSTDSSLSNRWESRGAALPAAPVRFSRACHHGVIFLGLHLEAHHD
jgi:hypothetical protein